MKQESLNESLNEFNFIQTSLCVVRKGELQIWKNSGNGKFMTNNTLLLK